MEGLIGARNNINMTNVPMRVYKEARRKGDLGTMERAMGYVKDYEAQAYEYKAKADEGMQEESREEKEKEKLRLQKEIEKQREERKELEADAEAKIQENRDQMQSATENTEVSNMGKPTHTNSEHNQAPGANTSTTTISPADTVEISAEGSSLSKELHSAKHPKLPDSQPEKITFYSSAGAAERIEQNNAPKLNVSV